MIETIFIGRFNQAGVDAIRELIDYYIDLSPNLALAVQGANLTICDVFPDVTITIVDNGKGKPPQIQVTRAASN